jgi:short-subunit dehydrogenase
VYIGALAHLVALSQALHEELKSQGVCVQALCPGVVAIEFHGRQGLEFGEVICAPGVDRSDLLDAAAGANLAAAQAPKHAERYRL